MEILDKIDIGHTQIFRRADGLVVIEGSNRVYSTFDIKEIHQAVQKINFQEKALLLIRPDQYTSVDQGARQFLATTEAGLQSIAEAYIIKSLAQRILLNFLIKVNGTPVPAKFFTDETEAIAWLKTHQSNKTLHKQTAVQNA